MKAQSAFRATSSIADILASRILSFLEAYRASRLGCGLELCRNPPRLTTPPGFYRNAPLGLCTTVSLCRPRRISECGTTLRRVRLTLLYGGADQAFVAPDPYQCSCPLVQRNRGCLVSELRFLDKRPYDLLYLRLASGPMQAAHAAGPKREIQGSVDAYEDPGKLGLAPHEHDPSHARGSPGEALGYTDELHAVLEASYPDAVVSGTELVFDLAHLGHVDSEPQESPEHQSGGLVVPLAYSPPRILGGADNGEAEGAVSCGGRAPTRASNEDRVSFLVRFSDGPVEPSPKRILPRHPDVAGGGRDRDGRGPLPSCYLLEEGSLIRVRHPRVTEPIRRQKLYSNS